MAEASIDIRVFPHKELTSVDMAEVLDAAIPNDGVIQGCSLELINGVFNISSGRLVVGGRLGVVTGGTIPNPTTLAQTETCWPLAVCDLSSNDNPFYFLVATAADLSRLGLDTEERNRTFNVENGIKAIVFGHCQVDPATGLASEYEALGQAEEKKGWDWWGRYIAAIELLQETTATKAMLDWKYAKSRDNNTEMTGKTANSWVLLPNDAREAHVTVWVRRSSDIKVAVDIHIPVHDVLFVTDATLLTHANMWGSTSDGFVEIQTLKDSSGRWIRINRVFAGTTNITDTVTWLVLYR